MSEISKSKRKRVSKNKKKNWRKTDINDIEEHLEDVRIQERTGGLAAEKLDEQLFFVDKIIDDEPKAKVKRLRREPKPLKCHALLEPNPNIKPAKISHNILKETTILKRKSIRVLKADNIKSKVNEKDAKEQWGKKVKARRSERRNKNKAKCDLWSDSKGTQEDQDEFYMRYTQKAKIKPPKYFNEKPSEIPAIEVPHPGQSFNPTYQDHQELLMSAHNVEVKKLKVEKKIKRALDEKFPSLAEAPNEKSWLAEMGRGINNDSDSEVETTHTAEELTQLSINPPVRRDHKKTEKQRRKMKEAREQLKERKKEKLVKSRKNELTSHLKSVKKSVNRRQVILAERLKKREEQKMENRNNTKKLGKLKYTDPDISVKLTSELVGSLRELKPEGNLMQERFKSMQKRNLIEPRQRAKKVRKYKLKFAEKKGHKEITL